jgi:lipopolysaccharide assembly protein A
MQIVRTVLWVLLAVAMVLFAIANWSPVEVRVWSTLVLETRLAALAIAAFLIGLVPMWLIHRAVRWRLTRRIATLEASLLGRSGAAPAGPVGTPAAAAEPLV